MTFSGRFVLSMIQYAVANGADFQSMLSIADHDYEFLCNEDSRVDSASYNRVIEACVDLTQDDLFGLHAGEYLNLSAAGLIGQITQTSTTVKEALEYCCEFANLGCRALPMALEAVDKGYKVDFIPDPIWEKESEVATRQTIDGVLAFTLREFHLLTIQKFYPKEIGFAFSRPKDVSEYERIFKCPLLFDQKNTYMLFDTDHVETKVVTSDYNLLRVLVKFAEDKLSEIRQDQGFYNLVRKNVMNLISPDFPTIEAVAFNMNMSVRTLQRKLKEEQKTFKDVTESLKKELAFSYMKKSNLSIKEIADLLNYSDTSAFTRSFKSWTGQTPSNYRSAI